MPIYTFLSLYSWARAVAFYDAEYPFMGLVRQCYRSELICTLQKSSLSVRFLHSYLAGREGDILDSGQQAAVLAIVHTAIRHSGSWP